MERGKKGLSTIVTTLIIILLVLAAIGIIWGPIRNLLSNSSSSLSQTSCFSLNIQATKVNYTGTAGQYVITLQRQDTGNSGIGSAGAYLVFYNSSTNNANPIDFEGSTGYVSGSHGMFTSPYQVQTATFSTGIVNATRLDVTAYYTDPNTGKVVSCSSPQTLSFGNA